MTYKQWLLITGKLEIGKEITITMKALSFVPLKGRLVRIDYYDLKLFQ